MRARFLSPALDDLTEAAEHFEETELERKPRLFEALDHAVQLIKSNPFIGKPAKEGVRRFSLHRLPYDVVYQIRQNEIVIVSVAHHRRDSSFWIERLK